MAVLRVSQRLLVSAFRERLLANSIMVAQSMETVAPHGIHSLWDTATMAIVDTTRATDMAIQLTAPSLFQITGTESEVVTPVSTVAIPGLEMSAQLGVDTEWAAFLLAVPSAAERSHAVVPSVAAPDFHCTLVDNRPSRLLHHESNLYCMARQRASNSNGESGNWIPRRT